MAIAKVPNIASAIEDLKKKGLWIYGAEAGGSDIYTTDFTGPIALVMGSEGFGISRLVKEKCDFLVSIPMYGRVNSFNVSTAAAVLLCCDRLPACQSLPIPDCRDHQRRY